MWSSIISYVLTVGVFGGAEAQADVLLSNTTAPWITLYQWETFFDGSGSVWLIGQYADLKVYATRIEPDGEKTFDKVLQSTTGFCSLMSYGIVTDRWGNAYFIYVSKENEDYGPYLLHLVRVSAADGSGNEQDYLNESFPRDEE